MLTWRMWAVEYSIICCAAAGAMAGKRGSAVAPWAMLLRRHEGIPYGTPAWGSEENADRFVGATWGAGSGAERGGK